MKDRSRRIRAWLTAILLIALCAAGTAQAETVGKSIIYSSDNPIPEIAANVRPAVVQIIALEEMWDKAYGTWTEEICMGSGVYIDERGYIVTNYHVVETASAIKVRLLDGTELEVESILSDSSTDIALLKIAGPMEGAEPVPMGDSDALVIGELAIVIGNPGSTTDIYPGTVTAGIISGLDRSNANAGNFSRAVNVIQMDAAVNAGNSGGALLNAKGELVGIPTLNLDVTYYGMYMDGMGFAVPINLVRDVTADLIEHGKVLRPRIGIMVADIEGPEVPLNNYPPAGVEVLEVEPGTPAEEAGMMVHDIITHIGGERVMNYAQMSLLLDRCEEGEVVTITVYRCFDSLNGRLLDKDQRESLDFEVEMKMLD